MKVLLTALNSKYIHTNLAVRYLHEFSVQRGYPCQICEYTINQHLPDILDEIYRQSPDVLMLSCYIWNIEMMLDLAEEYRRICPDVTIIAGGPEVSYSARRRGTVLSGIPTIPCKRTPDRGGILSGMAG